ncbi:MAG: hypothetical protein PVI75_02640 [Gammaproteobacteria bacterium]|jgi:hypothetical protein
MFNPNAIFKIIKHYQKKTTQPVKKSESSCFCGMLNLFGIFNGKNNTIQFNDTEKLQNALYKKINCDFIEISKENNKINIIISKKDFKNFKICCNIAKINNKNISILENDTEASCLNPKYTEIQISQKNAMNLLNALNTGLLMNLTFGSINNTV